MAEEVIPMAAPITVTDTTALLIQFTELRMQLMAAVEQMSAAAEGLQKLSALDKTMSEALVHQTDHGKQINRIWERMDEAQKSRGEQAKETAELLAKIKEACDLAIAESIREARKAQADVDAIKNQFSGGSRVAMWVSMLAGGLVSAGFMWLVSTVQESRERLKVLEYQITREVRK